jgi:hypothetical protein
MLVTGSLRVYLGAFDDYFRKYALYGLWWALCEVIICDSHKSLPVYRLWGFSQVYHWWAL